MFKGREGEGEVRKEGSDGVEKLGRTGVEGVYRDIERGKRVRGGREGERWAGEEGGQRNE